jgi:HK97 family phage prohead protease
MKTFERRMAVTGLEVRDEGDDLTLRGYASTFNQPYSMGWYTESVDAGAFKRTLGQKPDVRLLINHDGLPLARTASGTLTLSTDSVGLLASAKLDRNDPDVSALVPKMKRGDVDQMSFGFRVVDNDKGEPGHAWSPDMSQRTLTNLDLNGGDVSVVTYPANPNTSVGLRSGGRVPFEAMTSALLEMERRGAADDDIRALLTRMQEAFGDLTPLVTPPLQDGAVEAHQETSEMDEQQMNAARIAKEHRARILALL